MAMVTKENPSAESKKRFQSAAAGVGAEEEAEEGEADSPKDLVAVGANTISHWQINGTAWGNINNHDTHTERAHNLSRYMAVYRKELYCFGEIVLAVVCQMEFIKTTRE